MQWPLPQDFNEAVQNPGSAFSDPELITGQTIVGPTGLPLPRSGNFADVYQIRAANGRSWAVKCFTRPVPGLELRYKKVEDALDKAGLPVSIGFTFLNEGMMVRGRWYPAVKMEWVDGFQLNQVVRDQSGNPKVLDALGQMWSRLCKRLRETGIAHADIQHGNVLLVPGSKPGAYGLKLIDYDGMYVKALANSPSGESGHPNFQHPQRAAKQVYSPDLDRFPHLVIATALKGLATLGPALWERHDTGDNLLFTEDDFRDPASSNLMKELWLSNNPGLQALVGHLAIACLKPLPQTPWLDQIAPDGIAVPLSAEQSQAAAASLGLAPKAVVLEAAPAAANAFAGLDDESAEPSGNRASSERIQAKTRTKNRPAKEKKTSSMMPLALLAGVVVLVGGVAAGVMLLGGKKPDVVQKGLDEDKKAEPKIKGGAPAEPSPKSPNKADSPRSLKDKDLSEWGLVIDQDRDCKFLADGKKSLSIESPGTWHDLNPHVDKQNSPRVVRTVEGDFAFTVKVSGEFKPLGNPKNPDSLPSNGGGIVVWQDSDNFIRLERFAIGREGKVGPLILFLERKAGREDSVHNENHAGGDCYLRMERKGNQILGFTSTDGDRWKQLRPIETDWPLESRVKLGLSVANSNSEPLTVKFEEVALTGKVVDGARDRKIE